MQNAETALPQVAAMPSEQLAPYKHGQSCPTLDAGPLARLLDRAIESSVLVDRLILHHLQEDSSGFMLFWTDAAGAQAFAAWSHACEAC